MAKFPNKVRVKSMAHDTLYSHGKYEMFVPTCHFFHVEGHIRPKCF